MRMNRIGLLTYFFRKLAMATAQRPQSMIAAPIRTASAPPEIIAMFAASFHIQPRQAQITIRIASNPRIPPVTAAACFTVGLSYT